MQKRRRYSAEEKAQAVANVTNGSSVREVSNEIGVHQGVLRRWIKESHTPAQQPAQGDAQAEEIERLRREVIKLKAERDFLALEKRDEESEHSITKSLIVKATEELMVEKGYASLSTRKVAAKIGVTAALIHYYFPTTDDLLLAALQRKKKRHDERIEAALKSEDPLVELWNFYSDKPRTALELEFTSMVSQREAIRKQLPKDIEESRRKQLEGLVARFGADETENGISPLCIATLIAIVGRSIVTEQLLGITYGHDEVRTFIDHVIRQFIQESKPAADALKKTA
ncbi:MAG: TetR family transcriptional regulator [Novosphingobium sp.]|nr:TetR family transcriptional regulator [Novosphingobium sp.]